MAKQVAPLPKKIIVCCDGTWANSDNGWVKDKTWTNGYLANPSNVTHFSRALLPTHSDGTQQIVYYQAGIGSTSISWTDHVFAGMTGAGMSENIREAYDFISNNYVPGDSIYITGFSRGAYTARSVAGMIGGIGLLTKAGLVNFYGIFADYEGAGLAGYELKLPRVVRDFSVTVPPENADDYLDAYKAKLLELGLTQLVKVTVVGVWDTVGSLGVPIVPLFQQVLGKTSFQDYQFYDTKLGNHVEYAFQALALDERRFAFKPTLWERPKGCTTQLKQVWFAGAHGNVGGAAGLPDSSPALLSLAWMMDLFSPWLSFDPAYLSSQTEANLALYHSSTQPPEAIIKNPPPRYGCGPLYDSSAGYWSLVGSATRTPAVYHEVDYVTGKDLPELLEDTNERVHVSVRARVRFGGPGGNGVGEKGGYVCKALEGWVLEDKEEGEVRWVYKGKNREGEGKVMVEDELGVFEKQVMKWTDTGAERDLYGS